MRRWTMAVIVAAIVGAGMAGLAGTAAASPASGSSTISGVFIDAESVRITEREW